MFFAPPEGGYLSGFNQGMGFLLMAASPVVGILKIGFAAAAIGIGTVGTAIAVPSCLIEKGIRKIKHSESLNDPALKREALMQAFVNRISLLINAIAPGEASKRFLIENPKEIIVVASISLAFASKGEYGKVLVMADGNKLNYIDIQMLDPLFIGYFEKICSIRDKLREINYCISAESWKNLMTTMHQLCNGEETNLNQKVLNLYHSINLEANEIAELICEDNNFITQWNQKYPQ